MAAYTITIPYEEMAGSPTEEIGEQGFGATRTLRCDWDDRLTLAQQLRGGKIGSDYYDPHAYPHASGAVVTSIGITGHDDDRPMPLLGDTSLASYTKALLEVRYGSPIASGSGGGVDPVVVFEETIEPWAEFLTISPTGLTWGSGGPALSAEEAPGKLFKGLTWVYTRHLLTSIPSAVLTLTGKVNSGSLTASSLGLTFAAETLLYNPPLLTRQVTSDGTSATSLTYRFNYKEPGWNRFWRASTQAWERIYKGTTPADPYPTGSFTTLVA